MNPRYLAVHLISSQARSATLTPLRKEENGTLTRPQINAQKDTERADGCQQSERARRFCVRVFRIDLQEIAPTIHALFRPRYK